MPQGNLELPTVTDPETMASRWKYFCCVCNDPGPPGSDLSFRRYSRKHEKRGKSKRTPSFVTLTRRRLLDHEATEHHHGEMTFQEFPMKSMDRRFRISDNHDSAARLLDSQKSKTKRKVQDVFSDIPDGSHFRSDKILRLDDQSRHVTGYHRNPASNETSINFSALPVATGDRPERSSREQSPNSSVVDAGFFVTRRPQAIATPFPSPSDQNQPQSSSNTSNGRATGRKNESRGQPILLSVQNVNGTAGGSSSGSVKPPEQTKLGKVTSGKVVKLASFNGYTDNERAKQRGVQSQVQRLNNSWDSTTESVLLKRVSPRTGMASIPASKHNRNVPKYSQSDIVPSSQPMTKPEKAQSSVTRRPVAKVESMYGYVPKAVQNIYASTALQGNKIDDFFFQCHKERELTKFAPASQVSPRPLQPSLGVLGKEFQSAPPPGDQGEEPNMPERLAIIFEGGDNSAINGGMRGHGAQKVSNVNVHNGISGNDVIRGMGNLRIGGKATDDSQTKMSVLTKDTNGRHDTHTSANQKAVQGSTESSSGAFLTPDTTGVDNTIEAMWDTNGEVLY